MTTDNAHKIYTAKEICEELGITLQTLNRWYAWEKKSTSPKNVLPKLPQPIMEGVRRFWSKRDIQDIKNFQIAYMLNRGIMKNYNYIYWNKDLKSTQNLSKKYKKIERNKKFGIK